MGWESMHARRVFLIAMYVEQGHSSADAEDMVWELERAEQDFYNKMYDGMVRTKGLKQEASLWQRTDLTR